MLFCDENEKFGANGSLHCTFRSYPFAGMVIIVLHAMMRFKKTISNEVDDIFIAPNTMLFMSLFAGVSTSRTGLSKPIFRHFYIRRRTLYRLDFRTTKRDETFKY